MSFEYHELTTQVFLNAGKKSPGKRSPGKKPPGHCQGTEIPPCQPVCGTGLTVRDKKKGDPKKKALALLRQQLREALAAG